MTGPAALVQYSQHKYGDLSRRALCHLNYGEKYGPCMVENITTFPCTAQSYKLLFHVENKEIIQPEKFGPDRCSFTTQIFHILSYYIPGICKINVH